MSKAHFSSKIFPFAEQAAARERARIRRLIGPALRELKQWHVHGVADDDECRFCDYIVESIHAATRPEPKRKRGAK